MIELLKKKQSDPAQDDGTVDDLNDKPKELHAQIMGGGVRSRKPHDAGSIFFAANTAVDMEQMSAFNLTALIWREYQGLPAISLLDDYIHFEEQLKNMRAYSQEYIPQRFALEFAVLLRLIDYDKRLGLPESEMPAPGCAVPPLNAAASP